MKLYCSLSSYPIETTSFINFTKLKSPVAVHPILTLSKTELVTNKNKLETQSEKALFLIAYLTKFPLLFTIEKINYSSLTLETIETLPKAIRHLDHIETLQCRGYNFPTFNLTSDSINNLNTYLDILINHLENQHNTSLEKEHAHTKRLTKILNKDDKKLPAKITKWLFSNVDFPATLITGANRLTKKGKPFNHLDEYWETLFIDIAIKPDNCFYYPIADLEELYDFILENLENTNANSAIVYNILNKALKEYYDLTVNILSVNGTVETNSTAPTIESNLANAPKPIETNFPTKVDYLIMLAKWKLANPTI